MKNSNFASSLLKYFRDRAWRLKQYVFRFYHSRFKSFSQKLIKSYQSKVIVYKEDSVRRNSIKRAIKNKDCKIVVGASRIFQEGWIPTEAKDLNLLRSSDWEKFFVPNCIDAMLAEHVWDYLPSKNVPEAAGLCFKYLKPGARFRLAVPDSLFPNPEYFEKYIFPNYPPEQDARYDYRSLSKTFQEAGFQTVLLEYWDENGEFHYEPWDPNLGKIRRSSRFDQRNQQGALKYTSLIMDAIKPLK